MATLRIPSFGEVLGVGSARGMNSEAPNLWNGLVGAWPMQEGGGSTTFDVSGFGNHGTLTNMDPATDWVVGEKGRCLDFDGGNDYVIAGTRGVLATSGTVAVWAKPLSLDTSGLDNAVGYLFGHYNAGNRIYMYQSNADWYIRLGNSAAANTGADFTVEWQHLVLIWHSGNWSAYRNGVRYTSFTYVSLTAIGSEMDWGGLYTPGYEWPGQLNNGTVYNRALTASEIQQLYADPWAMHRQRRRVFASAGGAPPVTVAPTSTLYGPLVGPLGGAI